MRKRLVFAGSICTTLLFVFWLTLNSKNPDIGLTEQVKCVQEIFDYDEPLTKHGLENLYISSLKEQDEMPVPAGETIFFHETSSFGEEGISITARQACAVESAALMNPKKTIFLLIVDPTAKVSEVSKQIVKKLITSYDNVRIRTIVMDDYVTNTPLESWYTSSSVLQSSKWPNSHMSDILRYLTLWKFGGIYLDLDVVVTTSLDGLTNFAGAENWKHVAAGVMGFSPTGFGHQLADACLSDLKENFRGDLWGNNGPGVITRTLQNICATKYAKVMTESRCHGFIVFPPSAFYPIHYKNWKQYFTLDKSNATIKLLEKARAIHVWNKLSSLKTVQVGSRVPYDIVASKYCPKIHNNCGKTF